MPININSVSDCQERYLDYHCYGNTMGTTPQEMGMITQAWATKISTWQASVSNDETEYDFDDCDYAKYMLDGKEAAIEETGYDGKTGGQITRGVADGVVALGATAGATVAGNAVGGLVNSSTESLINRTARNAGEKVMNKMSGEATGEAICSAADTASNEVKDAAGNGAWILTAPLALATGLAYQLKKPNKEQKEACDKLQTEMTGAQGALTASQEEMTSIDAEIVNLADTAEAYNEEANDTIEEQKTEYDTYMQTYEAIKAKIDSGEALSESEKELYEEIVGYLTETGAMIEETSNDAGDEVSALYDEMGTYQDGYDNVAQTMGEIEGLTDYAEGFDKTTQTMCFVESAAQGLNALSGTKAAFQAGKFALSGGWVTAWGWAFAAMAGAGAAMSGVGAVEQGKWAGEVGTEIDMRKSTQDFNTNTLDIYTQEVDEYDMHMQGVEDLELEIPDDVEAPEDVELPPEPTGEDAVPDELKPPKEEKEEEEL